MSSIDIKRLSVVVLATAALVSCSGKKDVDMSDKSSDEALGVGGGRAADESQAKDLDPKFGKNIPDRVFFEYDSSALSSEAKAAIEAQSGYIAKMMSSGVDGKKASDVTITVEGYCDARGTREYNMALGQRRAGSVKAKLVQDGVAKSSIKTISYGKDKPAVLGDNEDAYAQNRRAVLVIESK